MAGSPLDHRDLFHTGIVVDDVELAKEELSATLGVTWGAGGSSATPVVLVDGPRTMEFTYAYTNEGPHRLELVAARPGTLWTVTAPGAAHHLGYWSDDVTAASAALEAQGLPRVATVGTLDVGAGAAIVLHQARTGLYVEVVDRTYEAALFGSATS